MAKLKAAEAEAAAAQTLLPASAGAGEAPADAPPDPERHEASITNPHGETLVRHTSYSVHDSTRLSPTLSFVR